MAASNRSIYLATPCYGGLAYADYMRGVLALGPQCAARGVGLDIRIGAGEALIGRGRATVMARFLAGDASHLLFVDADVGFEPDAVFRLLDSGFDVVGGVYPRKGRPGDELDELPPGASSRQGDFRTVASLGAGFLLISREAARRMVDGYPLLRARLGDLKGAGVAEATMVFDSFIDPDTRRYLADHQAFCRRWRDLGGLVWADGVGRLVHVGSGGAGKTPAPLEPLDRSAAQALWTKAELELTEGRLEPAERNLRHLLAAGATGPDVQYMLGYALLAQGRYAEGFQRYEARREIPAFRIALPPIPGRPWRGEPLAGKRLLIWPEQGLGDIIMFSRFALGLAETGAMVTMVVPAPLARVFTGTPVELLPLGGPIELQGYDYHVLAGDLPARCGADAAKLPPPWPIKASGASSRGRIGVATRGDPNHANDAHRSLPSDLAEKLTSLPGAISLLPQDTGAGDFRDTADLIAPLERVITVDTAIAHLAASMGKPTWILLPHLRTDWRWMRGRADSPWYPSVRLFRQPAAGQWSNVIDDLTQALTDPAHAD